MSFVQFARNYGLLVDDIVFDGVIHRVPVDGGKLGARDGAYCFYDDELGRAGWIKNYRTGEYQKYGDKCNYNSEIALRKELKKQNEINDRKALYDKTAATADYLIRFIFTPAVTHPYLTRKKVKSYGTYVDKGGVLIIPLRNINGKIRTFQRISDDGSRNYLKNGEVVGCFFQFGKVLDTVILCEGFATGASIYEASGIATVSAMNDGNLVNVALVFRKKYGDSLKIIIAGDDDYTQQDNPGRYFAIKAAKESSGICIFPSFTPEEKILKLTDFNDLVVNRGLDNAKTIILSLLKLKR